MGALGQIVSALFAPFQEILRDLIFNLGETMILIGILLHVANQRRLGRVLIRWALIGMVLAICFPLLKLFYVGLEEAVAEALREVQSLTP